MFRLVAAFIVIAMLIIAIVRYKNTADVIEVHGKKKREKKQILNEVKRGQIILRDEACYLLIQNKNEYILWVSDDKWGEREFRLTANGNYNKSFFLSNGEKIRLVVTKTELRLQQDNNEIVYPVK